MLHGIWFYYVMSREHYIGMGFNVKHNESKMRKMYRIK